MSLLMEDFAADNFLETILHCGLFIGALFQLIFIFAVIFTPPSKEEMDAPDDPEVTVTSSHTKQSEVTARKRQDKKKKK